MNKLESTFPLIGRGFPKEQMGKCIKEESVGVYPPLPFLDMLVKHIEKEKKKKEEKDILEVVNKVEVNIALLNVIK